MVPISTNGFPITPDDINDESDGIEAILPTDKLVTLISWVRIRIGAAGTGESPTNSEVWQWKNEYQLPKGIYKIIKDIPEAVKLEAKQRESNKKPFKRFLQKMKFLGSQCVYDDGLLSDILEVGLVEWLKNQ